MSIEQSKIFISYARADSEFALKLAEDLRSAGVDIWIDQLDVLVSERWDRVTEKALEGCKSFLLILSPLSVESENVMDELSYALEEKKQILPVLCSSCKIPFRIKRIQRSDFTDDYESGLKQLLIALNIQPSLEGIEQPNSKILAREDIKEAHGNSRKKTSTSPMQHKLLNLRFFMLAFSVVLALWVGYQLVKPMFDANTPVDSLTVSGQGPKYNLRSSPTILSENDVLRMLKRYDFYSAGNIDWVWINETGMGIENDFQNRGKVFGKVFYDATTGLTWQPHGSSKSMTFKAAQDYVAQLNRTNYCGYTNWRLPTLEEVMSLMRPVKSEAGLHIAPDFDQNPGPFWTADKSPDVWERAWTVNFLAGWCSTNDAVEGTEYVRAVR